jgi:hypothetical protein
LEFIVGLDPGVLGEWKKNKIPDTDLLARLHAMFWGKDMKSEASEWNVEWKTQLSIPDSESEPQDEDSDEEEEDAFIPGCYLLDITIENLFSKKIWIRADYIRIYDFVETYFKKKRFDMFTAPAVVVTGHPGVGEFALPCLISLLLNLGIKGKVSGVTTHYVDALARRGQSYGITTISVTCSWMMAFTRCPTISGQRSSRPSSGL